MGKTVTVIAGLVIASAVAYHYKPEPSKRRSFSTTPLGDELDREMDSVQANLEHSQHYLRHRLVPSIKANWNEQVTQVTHALIESDMPTRVKAQWDKHVLGRSSPSS
ncbi:hypothetical protein BC940DRAFT_300429 [Gongronella butleri]|nr:hypothetical protein BC940DRAFT_300429 [Gongronella butleri]